MTLLQFMSENPVLTFFLALIIGITIVGIFQYIAYAVRGDPNIIEDDEDDEDE